MEIDNLADRFSNSMIITLYNPTHYQLFICNEGLYTQELIKANTILGELNGIPTYIWEIRHNNYIIIDDELILDVQNCKGNMLNHVREENLTNNPSNCCIFMRHEKDNSSKFYLVCTKDIAINDEIVYDAQNFVVNMDNNNNKYYLQ